ncbi:MAG: biotin transporter BioY, partial [Phycisphaerales bacterium]
MAWVLSFALLTALAAKIQVPMWPVPLTLQTAVVLLAGVVLGPVAGAASQVLYLGLGLAGAPVFAGPVAGPGYLLLPTAGYLLGFVPAAAVAGYVSGPVGRRGLGRLVAGVALATAVVFMIGIPWLAVVQNLGYAPALKVGLVPFAPGAVLKGVLVVSIARLLDSRRGRLS